MAPVRLVSQTQLELIVEFAERNKHIAGRAETGPLANRQANQAWVELAKNLNAVEDGTKKAPEQWKRYWHLLKCRTKAKAADIRRKRAGTVEAGVHNKLFPLTDLEKRIMWAIGMVGVPRILHAPPSEVRPARPRPVAVPAAAMPTLPIRKVEMVEQPRYSSGGSEAEEQADLPRWLCDMEERRIASEERLTNAVVTLSTTNESILRCLQEMADTHTKLLGLLENHLSQQH